MTPSSMPNREPLDEPADAPSQTAASIEALASTINRAIEQAEDLGIASAVQLLMMARLEVDLTEIARESVLRNGG